jgi:hypothetical protein
MMALEDRQGGTVHVSVRIPAELLSRVEEHRHALSQAAGGAAVDRSFALCHLLHFGLESQRDEQE